VNISWAARSPGSDEGLHGRESLRTENESACFRSPADVRYNTYSTEIQTHIVHPKPHTLTTDNTSTRPEIARADIEPELNNGFK
jgi:hypothetical protein